MGNLFEGLLGLGLEEKEAKTYIALIDFIVINSARNDLDGDLLVKELIDLGIPKENCVALGKVYSKSKSKLRSYLQDNSLKSSQKQK